MELLLSGSADIIRSDPAGVIAVLAGLVGITTGAIMLWDRFFRPRPPLKPPIKETIRQDIIAQDGSVAIGGDAKGSVIQVHKTIIPPAPTPVPHQIPPPPRDFTGRKEELEELLEGFDRGATITGLRGMGGIGKTALALVLAEKLAGRFPDGQLFIDMRGTGKKPLTSAEAMAHVIRAYLPKEKLPEGEQEIAGLYRSVLAGKRALLLLDNAAGREQVEPLLPPSGSAVIVTSRNRFSLPGLEEKDLDLLPLKDAIRLLLEIAERIGSHAEELARVCGCLPLALRNAAYTLKERKDLVVDEYLTRLKDAKKRLELVEASFSLSYELLSPELQSLWCMLSVFPSDFDRAGAAAVWKVDSDSAAEALSGLLRLSLVEYRDATGRYHLHDLARDFAASRLEDAARAEAEERHAEHYRNVLSRADELYLEGGDDVLAGLKLFDLEEANILAGQAWAAERINSSLRQLLSAAPTPRLEHMCSARACIPCKESRGLSGLWRLPGS